MILGLSLVAYTQFHVALSLIGIFTGLVVLVAMIGGRLPAAWNAIFLITTVLTSVTGFFFPVPNLLPSHVFGIISLVVLAAALFALYVRHLVGVWRVVFAVGAVIALYLNVFVAVVQSFLKLDFVRQFAPTQSEPPFAIAHAVVLVIFVVLGVLAVMRLRRSH